jgi:hypothetical protein
MTSSEDLGLDIRFFERALLSDIVSKVYWHLGDLLKGGHRPIDTITYNAVYASIGIYSGEIVVDTNRGWIVAALQKALERDPLLQMSYEYQHPNGEARWHLRLRRL